MRNETIVAGIAHWRIQKAVDEQRAGRFVHLVLYGLAADPNLNDDIDILRGIDADGNGVKVHGRLLYGVTNGSGRKPRRLSNVAPIGNLRTKPVCNDVDLLLRQQRWRMSATRNLDETRPRAAPCHLLGRVTQQQIGVLST